MDEQALRERLSLAARWLIDVAPVRDEAEVTPAQRAKHHHASWKGALKGEYRAATREWGFYCPSWHTGQAVKALVAAAALGVDGALEGARAGAGFLLGAMVADGADRGLLLAYEDFPDKVNTSAVLESVDGLFVLAEATGDERYARAGLAAVDWVQRRAVIPGSGLVRDLYDPSTRSFVPRAFGTEGRPLIDDGAFLTAWRLAGEERFLETAVAIADRLCADEDPPGNWVGYAPCDSIERVLHPRHAYWWGRPLLSLWRATGTDRYRELFLRACGWYRGALRRDGGLFRGTAADFTTDSFGHAASGSACAALMFLDAVALPGQEAFGPLADRCLSWCAGLQFTRPRDPALEGCVLEKVLPPDGTDDSPYHVRDLGTIFFVQAAAATLAARPA